MLRHGAWLVLAVAALSSACIAGQKQTPGQILESVPALQDPTQSYALYLPSALQQYRWPAR